MLGGVLAVALVKQGWTLRAEPGDAVTLERDGIRITPFTLFGDLEEKKVTPDDWRALCAKAWISDLDLAAIPAGGQAQ